MISLAYLISLNCHLLYIAIVTNALRSRPSIYDWPSPQRRDRKYREAFSAEAALYLRFRGVGEGGERESVRLASSELLRFDSGRSLGRRAIDRGDEGKPLVGASHRRLAVFPMIRQLCADFLTRPSVCQSVPTCLFLPLEFPSQPGLPRATRIIL